MGATSISMPVMMVFSFLPMLAMFNERIQSAAKILYTQQLKLILDEMTFQKITMETGIILLINAGVMFALFCTAFRKKGLE